MKIVFPKDDRSFSWTNHMKGKMVQYQLSAQRIRRVLQSPKRREEGIAPGTVAAMQELGGKKKTELWIMYQKRKIQMPKSKIQKSPHGDARIVMISAWRYPGVTKPGTPVPIPNEIQEELAALFREHTADIDKRT